MFLQKECNNPLNEYTTLSGNFILSDIEELSKLDDLILEEKRIIAREYFCDVWESAIREGIDAEIIADELITGVLVELARNNGNEAVTKFVSCLSERDETGAFVPDRVLQ